MAELLPGATPCFATLQAIVSRLDQAGWASVTLRCGPGGFDPLTLLAGLVPHCPHIGLVAEIDPAHMAPYTAARRLAALDHASGGRAGWQIVDSTPADVAQDYAGAVLSLWDGWDDGAHVIDRHSGRYIDIGKVHPSHYRGPYFSVAGPLDIPPPIQRHAVRYGYTAAPGVENLARTQGHLRLVSLTSELAQWLAAIAQMPATRALGTPGTLRQRLGLPHPPSPRRGGQA